MELLSPAGDREAFEAAVKSGADAVYLGATAFSARAGAGNFDGSALADACRYARVRGKKVYLAVNTLLAEDEYPELERVINVALDAGVNAFIVQDAGVLRAIREMAPFTPLHASTQMAVHSVQGALAAKRLGCSRVILARECSLEEAREVAKSGVETEMFVHGALCVAQSGQCLMSSMAGGRSGNRGRCAQPCRQPFALTGSLHAKGYLLSPKDLCLLPYLKEIIASGVSSLKIEGRMKRPEYVAVVTRVYRQALDAALEGRAFDEARALVELKKIYHRGGFTAGHAVNFRDDAFLSSVRPGHEGLPVGEVLWARRGRAGVLLTEPLSPGDGLEARAPGAGIGIVVRESLPAGQGELSAPEGVRQGMTIWRTTDAKQIEAVSSRLREEGEPVQVFMKLEARIGQPALLTIFDSTGITACAASATPVEPSQNRPTTREELIARLLKTGGTPFTAAGTEVFIDDNAFIPASSVNALRRDALARLEDARDSALREYPKPEAYIPLPAFNKLPRSAGETKIFVQTATPEQANACAKAGADRILWQPTDWRGAFLLESAKRMSAPYWLHLPPILSTKALREVADTAKNLPGIAGFVASNIGQLGALPLPAMGDFSLHMFSARAARQWLDSGLERVTASPELSAPQLKQLLGEAPCDVVVYGRIPLMNLRHCPARAEKGARSCEGGCLAAGCALRSHLGHEYALWPIHTPDGCTVQLLNSQPLSLHREISRLREMGAASIRLVFHEEAPEECARLLSAFRDSPETLSVPGATRGAWKRPHSQNA